MLDFTNKIVLITGIGCQDPGWGNGLAIAASFIRQGATVFGCDLILAAAEESRMRILQQTPTANITVMQADATSSESMEAFVATCLAKLGRIDVLVNNVGRSEPGDPATMTEKTWTQQVDVNLKSVYLTTHLVLPIMENQEHGGNIVNISSVAGHRYIGKPQVAYAAAKAAIIQFTKATAVIYASRKVRLNVVTPGLIDTPLVQRLAEKYAGGRYEEFRKTRDQQVPMGRMGTAWDVANSVLFLASDEAGYVTGGEIVVDGGLVCSTGEARL
ncbi:hypothetical protein BDW59DRAFT_168664 [Aspergillus cavernicola]|uniref:Short chain type dehydrogenase n=1 Tax=Aspergillus cavernicola TaxID=176166 RepID=A0ABR4J5T9_9EURO